jgi:hypothetical protein
MDQVGESARWHVDAPAQPIHRTNEAGRDNLSKRRPRALPDPLTGQA